LVARLGRVRRRDDDLPKRCLPGRLAPIESAGHTHFTPKFARQISGFSVVFETFSLGERGPKADSCRGCEKPCFDGWMLQTNLTATSSQTAEIPAPHALPPPRRLDELTPEVAEVICKIIRLEGLADHYAGALTGVSRAMLERWKAGDEAFALALEEARAQFHAGDVALDPGGAQTRRVAGLARASLGDETRGEFPETGGGRGVPSGEGSHRRRAKVRKPSRNARRAGADGAVRSGAREHAKASRKSPPGEPSGRTGGSPHGTHFARG